MPNLSELAMTLLLNDVKTGVEHILRVETVELENRIKELEKEVSRLRIELTKEEKKP